VHAGPDPHGVPTLRHDAMSLVRRAVQPSRAAGARRGPGRRTAAWLVPCCYLIAALVLTWRLWPDPAGRAQLLGPVVYHDVYLFDWFMRYDATAVAHGGLPALITTALNAPRGVNLMWNTSLLLPGVVLAPVTLLAGPQASLNVLLTLGFAGSAASLYLVLRRWGASISAAALGGAVYGFSPALLAVADGGHYHLQFAVLPPLIIDALLRIVTGRGRSVRTGVWLGVLMAAQVFIGEELLVDTAVAGLVLVAVLAAGRPGAVPGRVRGAAAGLASAAAAVLVICGYALWIQFHGPLAEHGTPWATSNGGFRNALATFVVPPGNLLFHGQAAPQAVTGHLLRMSEYVAYLGWPLLAVLLAAAIRFWRDPRIRAAVVTLAVLELLSLGTHTIVLGGFSYPGALLPARWLKDLPGLAQVQSDRFSLLADGAAAAALAFSLDLARAAVPRTANWARRTLPTAVAVLAVLPLLPLPLQADETPPVPAGWHAAFAGLRLAPEARVLVVPGNDQAQHWQADTGEPVSLIGGYCIAPGRSGRARDCNTLEPRTARYLDALWQGVPGTPAPSRARIGADLAHMRLAAVIAVSSLDSPVGRFLTGLFGAPTVHAGQVLAWRRPTLGMAGTAAAGPSARGAGTRPSAAVATLISTG
jgi:hypothetical protein